MKAYTETERKYYKYSDTSTLINADGVVTSNIGGNGWEIYPRTGYGEVYLMLNATANTSYPRWQYSSPNVYAYVKTPKKCIITSYSTTQWCDSSETGRICNHWIIKGYNSYSDLISLSNGTVIDDNTWSSISKGSSKTIDLSSNTNGFQYYSIQMVNNFAGSSYCSMGSTKFYARVLEDSSSSDYDYYKDIPIYKVVNQTENNTDIYKAFRSWEKGQYYGN